MTGKELRDKRKSRGWTQLELARKIGVSKGTVVNYEKGKTIPESKSQILLEVFRKKKDGFGTLENKLGMMSSELVEKAKKSERPSSFILEEVLSKFHPVEVIDYIDRNRDKFFSLEEFQLLSKNASGLNEIEKLKSEIKKINDRIDNLKKA